MGKPEPPMMMMPGFKADIGKVMLTKDDDEMNIVVNNNFHGGHGGLMMHGGFKHHDHHHHQKTKYFVASGHEDTCMVMADKQIMEGNPMQDACMKVSLEFAFFFSMVAQNEMSGYLIGWTRGGSLSVHHEARVL